MQERPLSGLHKSSSRKLGFVGEEVMRTYTKDDIIQIVEEEDVEFIRLQFTDMLGTLKNIAITASQLPKALEHACTFDGSCMEGFIWLEEEDMYLHPDPSTFEIFPWRPQQGKVARLLCDVYKCDGTPFESDSRQILKRTIKRAQEKGYTMEVGSECEFFLFHMDEEGNPTTVTHECAGYFDIDPMDFGENTRRDIVLTLEEMGFVIESSHHEVAPAQHEIVFRHSEALSAADDILTFKMVVRTIAKKHGLHATFMPKPKSESTGSGMHLNLTLQKEGRNLFFDEKDPYRLSREAYYFIGGLMKHIGAVSLFTNPIVNSYKRLIPGFDAPIYANWSVKKKSALIRIPFEKEEKKWIELRSPDASANPYLALAVCLAAGMDGIERKILPPSCIDEQEYREQSQKQEETCRLPKSLLEAVEAFEQDELMQNVIGKELSQKYIQTKKREYREYCAQVTAWELEQYLYRI